MDVKSVLHWQDMADQLISMTLVVKAEIVIVIVEALVKVVAMVTEIGEIEVVEIDVDPLEDLQGDPIQGLVQNLHAIDVLEVIVDHHVTIAEVYQSHQDILHVDQCRHEDARLHLIDQDQDPEKDVIKWPKKLQDFVDLTLMDHICYHL